MSFNGFHQVRLKPINFTWNSQTKLQFKHNLPNVNATFKNNNFRGICIRSITRVKPIAKNVTFLFEANCSYYINIYNV